MTGERSPRITLVPEKPLIAAGRESQFDLLIRIDAPPNAGSPRRPINLGLVLDRSGSMQGQKLIRAQQALIFAVNNMAPQDRVSLVAYDKQVSILVGGGPVSEVGPRIIAALHQVRAMNSTALHDGWVQGGLQVSAALDPGGVNRVLLLSDGLANEGETSTKVIVSRAAELFARGVSTSTVGVGRDFNEDLMIPMAVAGGGAGWFVETPNDFRRIFEAELAGLFSLFGERGVLRIAPRRAGVSVVEVLNDFPKLDLADGGWAVGTLSYGSQLEVVARIKATGGEPGQPLDLLEVDFEIDAIGQERIRERRVLGITCDGQDRVDALPSSPEVQRAVALLMAARSRVEAISRTDEGDYGSAQDVLHCAVASLGSALGDDDAEAVLEKAQIEELIRMYAKGDPDSVTLARKQAAYQSYSRSSGLHQKGLKPVP